MQEGEVVSPVRWAIGPPPPRSFTLATRVLQVACFVLMATWIGVNLGGLRLSPRPTEGNANDTSQLFNWHPLLIALAFPVIMGEALLSYQAPVLNLPERSQRKAWHVALQSTAALLTTLAVVAAFKSHTLKKPAPMPNLYSTHSYLGMIVLALFGLQYVLGFAAYLFPKFTLASRRALGPVHIFLGKATFTLGMATMAVGIQEKCTFIQLLQKPSVYAAVLRLPAVLQLLLAATAMAVLFHHAPPAVPAPKPEVETVEALGHFSESEPLNLHHDA